METQAFSNQYIATQSNRETSLILPGETYSLEYDYDHRF